jgi:hypothetical protein
MRRSAKRLIEEALRAEVDLVVDGEPYERTPRRKGSRNGWMQVARTTNGDYYPRPGVAYPLYEGLSMGDPILESAIGWPGYRWRFR